MRRHFFYTISAFLLILYTIPLRANDVPSKERFLLFYSPYFLELLQIAYGSTGMISQGGIESVDKMFSGIDLEGKSILDIGSGLGRVDLYLATKNIVQILGVDLAPYMVSQASALLAKEQHTLKGSVSFSVLQNSTNLKEFADNSFDIVFSKEVFYHIPLEGKQEYLQEIYRVLKPGGKVVIADWGQKARTPVIVRAIRTEGSCFLITPSEFLALFAVANLQHTHFQDVSKDHENYTRCDLERIQQAQNLLQSALDPLAYDHALISFNLWLEALRSGDLIAGIFVGEKPFP